MRSWVRRTTCSTRARHCDSIVWRSASRPTTWPKHAKTKTLRFTFRTEACARASSWPRSQRTTLPHHLARCSGPSRFFFDTVRPCADGLEGSVLLLLSVFSFARWPLVVRRTKRVLPLLLQHPLPLQRQRLCANRNSISWSATRTRVTFRSSTSQPER